MTADNTDLVYQRALQRVPGVNYSPIFTRACPPLTKNFTVSRILVAACSSVPERTCQDRGSNFATAVIAEAGQPTPGQ
jgi:hypothetical protein